MALTITDKIFRRIKAGKGEAAFGPKDFLHIGSRAAVDQALSRLARSGRIRRVCRGIYDYPEHSEFLKRDLPATAEPVAKAAARKTGSRLQVAGALAANILGLSTQVPAKEVYMTDGPSKILPLTPRLSVELRHASPGIMVGAGTMTGIVLQALRYMGRDHIDGFMIQRIRHLVTQKDRRQLLKDTAGVTDWMRPILAQIAAWDDYDLP